jgi:H+/Cl- antiporter ClcA
LASPLRHSIQEAWRRRIGPIWKSRLAAGLGAVALGVTALAFAQLADLAQHLFRRLITAAPLAPLALTPLAFMLIVWVTRHWAPQAKGSGIPQIIAAGEAPENSMDNGLVSVRTGVVKFALTIVALLAGASVGREGPTVQIGASVMAAAHRLLRVPVNAAVIIAGGAAGVSAAFNTPLAGVAFAIEELAAAYEQRLALLVMAAVMISGLVSLSLAGDYVYFGVVHRSLPVGTALLIAPVAGVVGGVCGGFFSRILLSVSRASRAGVKRIKSRPLLFAGACGLLVAVIGMVSGGLTWGTGYAPARAMVEGAAQPWWFTPAKFAATLLTSVSGAPGGIFAPSLATGAGVGGLIADAIPGNTRSAVVMLGMIAYFVGVVRAPLTGVVIVSEMTADRAMILPLFLAAIVADFAAKAVCKERLYHGLSAEFRPRPADPPLETELSPLKMN